MPISPELEIDFTGEVDRIADFIIDRVERKGADGVILGMSGGIDSSISAALGVRALSPNHVHALMLPERDSSPESVEDACEHAGLLGIRYKVFDLTEPLKELGCYESGVSYAARVKGGVRAAARIFPGLARKGFLANLEGEGGKQFREFIAYFRIKHRLRMVEIYREAERKNLAVLSCANRTEYETGFFVRYGDDAGDIAPIRHLYKTQLFEMGKLLQIPAVIIKKSPSPDLFAGMKDEEIMGISYEKLDGILWGLSHGMKRPEIEKAFGVSNKSISYVSKIKKLSKELRLGPDLLRGTM